MKEYNEIRANFENHMLNIAPSNFTALQDFAKHYIMVGRKIESDLMVEAAIRNNTGE